MPSEITKMLDKFIEDIKYGFDYLFDIIEEHNITAEQSIKKFKAIAIYKKYWE